MDLHGLSFVSSISELTLHNLARVETQIKVESHRYTKLKKVLIHMHDTQEHD